MSNLEYIERSREDEESRIVGNWIQRLTECLKGNEGKIYREAIKAADISQQDLKNRKNLTQAKLDIILSILHDRVPDILFRLYNTLGILDLEVLGYAVMSSRTIHKALELLTRFNELTTDLYDLMIQIEDNGFLIFPVPRPGYVGSLRYIAEENTAGIWKVLDTLVEDKKILRKCNVSFNYSPPSSIKDYEEFFGCQVTFDAPTTGIHVTHEIGDMEINHANTAMVEACSAICDRLIPKTRVREDLRRAVQRLLLSKPEKKMLKLEDAANELRLSVSQLRKGLYRLGTSYKQVSLEVRMALAKHYLAETNLKIDEIAYLLNYAHGGAFSRAFKTEFGYPPIQFRQSILAI